MEKPLIAHWLYEFYRFKIFFLGTCSNFYSLLFFVIFNLVKMYTYTIFKDFWNKIQVPQGRINQKVLPGNRNNYFVFQQKSMIDNWLDDNNDVPRSYNAPSPLVLSFHWKCIGYTATVVLMNDMHDIVWYESLHGM
jgi:hypothetical protein